MALTYNLGFVPKWYIADLVGKPLGGGYLAAFSNINHTTQNLIYQDPAGTEPWPLVPIPNTALQGILFDENGSQGPFYFLFNTGLPNILYYLEVYDSNGVLQWTMDNYIPPAGTGGSIITSVANLNNIIINNVLWRNFNQNIASNAFPAVAPGQFKVIAPGAHAGFSHNVNQSVGAGNYWGSDIVFLKNSVGETDSVNFGYFPLGVNTLSTDITPFGFFNYTCTAPASGTIKCIQFPVNRNVQSLANKTVTITFWARVNAGSTDLTLKFYQFFGDGGGSAPVTTAVNVFTLTAAWTFFSITTPVPSVIGNTLGSCGNDALFIQFQYHLNAATNIDFIKPTLYLGNTAPATDFITNDAIDAIINSPRTGNIRVSYDITAELGYLPMNDGTIGQTGSGATIFAGADVFPLYNLLYQNVSRTDAPVAADTGQAVSNFTAGNLMTIPKALGRALSQAGLASGGSTTWRLGQNSGSETQSVTLSTNNLPPHHHATQPGGAVAFLDTSGGSGFLSGSGGQAVGFHGITGDTGNAQAFSFGIFQPSTFMNYFIKM